MVTIRQRRADEELETVSSTEVEDDRSSATINEATTTTDTDDVNEDEGEVEEEDEGDDDEDDDEGEDETVEDEDDDEGEDETVEDEDDDEGDANNEKESEEFEVQDDDDKDDDKDSEELDVNDAEITDEDDKVTEDEEKKDDEDEKVELLNSESEGDDFALALIEEELQELEEFESESGSSLSDDVLTVEYSEKMMVNDDQMDGDIGDSTTNESFVPPSSDGNGNDMNIISLPSNDSGAHYNNQHWNYVIPMILIVCAVGYLSKYFVPNHATKRQRRRNMDHKRLPTIEDDDSSA